MRNNEESTKAFQEGKHAAWLSIWTLLGIGIAEVVIVFYLSFILFFLSQLGRDIKPALEKAEKEKELGIANQEREERSGHIHQQQKPSSQAYRLFAHGLH